MFTKKKKYRYIFIRINFKNVYLYFQGSFKPFKPGEIKPTMI